MKLNESQATAVGLTAVALWSALVGLIHGVSEFFGATGGAALIYTTASVILLVSSGFPKLRAFPRTYLYLGSLLFVSYELCLALSIGFAQTGQQAIEVSILNYLWPSLTILFAILFNGKKSTLLIVPGMLLAIAGVGKVLSGPDSHGLAEIFSNIGRHIGSNPFSYLLALLGAFIWAAYCTVTTRLANGANGITWFFMLTALTLWVIHFSRGGAVLPLNLHGAIWVVAAACAMGFGYAAWNIGILKGNVTALATASYFIPIFSSALAATLLGAPLSASFWQGAIAVCAGSLLCWQATRVRTRV